MHWRVLKETIRKQEIHEWKLLTYFSSIHCDHNEMIIRPNAAAKLSESGLEVSVDSLSSKIVESARSPFDGNANVVRRSNVLGSSGVNRWSSNLCVSFGGKR